MKATERRPSNAAGRAPMPRWLRRLGVLGGLFFLLKGLLWLAVPTWLIGRGCGF